MWVGKEAIWSTDQVEGAGVESRGRLLSRRHNGASRTLRLSCYSDTSARWISDLPSMLFPTDEIWE